MFCILQFCIIYSYYVFLRWLLVRYTFFALAKEIEEKGPVRGNWPNYGRLSKTKHHCHIKKGQPTYVVCWEERNGNIEIEVYYVGTHEKAPY